MFVSIYLYAFFYSFIYGLRWRIRCTTVRLSVGNSGSNIGILLEFEEECSNRSAIVVLGNGRGAAIRHPMPWFPSSASTQAKLY